MASAISAADPGPVADAAVVVARLAELLDTASQAINGGQALAAGGPIEEALALAQQHGLVAGQAQAHLAAARRTHQLCDQDAAAGHAAAAQALAALAGDSELQARGLVISAHVNTSIADYGQALADLEAARAVRPPSDADALSFDFHNALGNVQLRLGQWDASLASGELALRVAHRLGDLRRQAIAQGNLGGRWIVAGEGRLLAGQAEAGRDALDSALAILQQAVAVADAIAANYLNLCNVSNQGICLVLLERDDEAMAAFERHARLAADVRQPATRAAALMYEARLHQRRGRLPLAIERAQQGITIAEEAHDLTQLMSILELMAELEEQAADAHQALQHLKRLYKLRVKSTADAAEQRSRVMAVRLQTERALREAAAERERADALRHANAALERHAELLSRHALEDALTGLANRRQVDLHLQHSHARAVADGHAACLAILDIDHFKLVNDRHSHAVGDRVLQQLAALLREHCRKDDLAGRLGGEEFVLCFHRIPLDQAAAACERLRAAVQAHAWGDVANGLALTVSIGLVALAEHDSVGAALAAADALLYQAKNSGRNRVKAGPGR